MKLRDENEGACVSMLHVPTYGRSLAGNWQLKVIDSAGSDLGTLDAWCLIPATNASQPQNVFENGSE
jgi:subtilisin-like proprotein convertase family protein